MSNQLLASPFKHSFTVLLISLTATLANADESKRTNVALTINTTQPGVSVKQRDVAATMLAL